MRANLSTSDILRENKPETKKLHSPVSGGWYKVGPYKL